MWKIGKRAILEPENSIELSLAYFICPDPTVEPIIVVEEEPESETDNTIILVVLPVIVLLICAASVIIFVKLRNQ